jgi:hypothetical protein
MDSTGNLAKRIQSSSQDVNRENTSCEDNEVEYDDDYEVFEIVS